MDVRRISGYWPFGVLCAVLASRWTLAYRWPDSVSSVSSLALALLIGAAGTLFFALARKQARKERRLEWKAVSAGVLLFAGLNAGLLAGDAGPHANDLLIALALTPVVVAVALVSFGEAPDGLNGIDVAPGMMAPAGLLLILSQPRFGSAAETAVLLGAPLCAGVGAVWLVTHAEEETMPWRAAMAFGGPGVLFGTVFLMMHRTWPSIQATVLDLVVVVLTMWTLVQLGPRRFSALFALVPLLLLLEGLLLTLVPAHLWPGWQQAGGLVLLLAASVLLLRLRRAGEEAGRLFPFSQD